VSFLRTDVSREQLAFTAKLFTAFALSSDAAARFAAFNKSCFSELY
jgi:hypothetical protein